MESNELQQYQRSHEPIFWGLFGFGGMVIAFAFPILVALMLYVGATGDTTPFQLQTVCSHWWGAGAMFLILLGATFHCAHRILFSLTDLKIHIGTPAKAIAYTLAALLPLVFAAYYIISLA